MNASLENKVAVVTGGTSGIGKATSLALAKAGAKVVVAGRRENEGQAVVQAIEKSGGKALFVKTDVSREADVKALWIRPWRPSDGWILRLTMREPKARWAPLRTYKRPRITSQFLIST